MTEDELYHQMLEYIQQHPGAGSYTFEFLDLAPEDASVLTQAALRVMQTVVGPIIIIKVPDA